MWFTRISIQNPVFATMVMLAFVVLGIFSYQRLQVDQWPDIEFPVVVVTTDYPGASPEAIESEISRKIEEAVNSINGVKTISSRSFEGSSLVMAEFELYVNAEQAAQDVRDKVAAVKTQFRKEVKEPKILRFDPADRPIISLAVNGPGRDLREITTLADQVIKRRLENVRGVGSVTLVGGVKRQVLVYLKLAEMEALGISAEQIINAVKAENQELPTGAIRAIERERVVRLEGRLKEIKDFQRIIVARRGGQPVFLEQVASVVDGQEEQESLAAIDGQRALALDILKARGQNTIEVSRNVSEAIQAISRELPQGVSLSVVKDASKPIRTGVANTEQTMIEGALLTIAIVFLFLGSWRSTVITGLTLPIAILGTFLALYWFGFTINMLTLMAMSLCIGLLIDDAIVVRENIVRHAALGADHGREHDRVLDVDEHRARRLARDLAGFQHDLVLAPLEGLRNLVEHAHELSPFVWALEGCGSARRLEPSSPRQQCHSSVPRRTLGCRSKRVGMTQPLPGGLVSDQCEKPVLGHPDRLVRVAFAYLRRPSFWISAV